MAKRLAKTLFGITLLPFCLGFTWQFGVTVFSIVYKPGAPYFFVGGGLAYLTIHLLFKKPIFTYVVGHELTHAFFAMLFGGSVKSLQVSDRGGRVAITKSNFIITLAPYFFPLYTFIALVLYGTLSAAGADIAALNAIIFVSGATFTFHLMLTFIFLQTDQSDISEQGALFSYPLIYLFNIAFAALLVHIYLAANMDYLAFFAGGIMKSTGMITLLIKKTYAFVAVL
jgi:hypothetical protein